MHSGAQLEHLKSVETLHLDATGGLIRKSEYVNRQMFLFSAVSGNSLVCFPSSEMLSERCRTDDVISWLVMMYTDFSRATGGRIFGNCVVRNIIIDMSWVLLHSSLFVFCRMTVSEYLVQIYNHLQAGDPCPDVTVFLCGSHLLNNFVRHLRDIVKGRDTLKCLIQCLVSLYLAPSITEAGCIWHCMCLAFGSQYFSAETEKTFNQLDSFVNKTPRDVIERIEGCVLASDDGSGFTDEWPAEESICNSSPFSHFFKSCEVFSGASGDCQNRMYHPKALDIIRQKWLPLYGFFCSAAIIGKETHYTNAKVESWFR